MIQALKSSQLPAPQFRYSPVVQAGNNYQMAGMVALDKESGQLVGGGAYQQTKKILSNMQAALPDFGLTLGDLLIARIFTTEFNQFAEINDAWDETFKPCIRPPARTAMGVSALPLGALVEIEFCFYLESQEVQL